MRKEKGWGMVNVNLNTIVSCKCEGFGTIYDV